MNRHLESEKSSRLTFIIILIIYTIISMTKNTYSTAIATIVQDGLFTKADAGVINAGFYLLYSIAQMFGGILVEKVSPFKMLTVGFGGALVTNIIMALSTSFTVMLIAWSINGLLQFGVWPVILKLTTSIIRPEHRQKASAYLYFAYPFGSVVSYILAGSLLRSFSWPSLFWSSAATLFLSLVAILWLSGYVNRNLEPESSAAPEGADETKTTQEESVPNFSFFKILFTSGLIFLTAPAIIRCMLDIGLKNWVPTMIMETYGVAPSFANLLTTVLVIVNLGGLFVVNWLYKRLKNVASTFGCLFLMSVPLLLLIVYSGKVPLILILLSLALSTTFSMSASQAINVIMPSAFAKYQKTGFICSFINSFGGIGVMIANYAYGLLADNFGWTVTAVIWLVLCIVATVLCFIAAPFWKRFTAKN